MASEVDICNLGLVHIAHDAVVSAISPADGSAEADHCARFYPIARDELLEMHAWRFALRRDALAYLAETSAQWTYAYALPSNCLRPLAVLLPTATDDSGPQPYTIELGKDLATMIVFTNAQGAVLKYITRQADPTKFTPGFVSALAMRVGGYLAGAIPKDLKLKAGLIQASEAKALDAAAADAESANTALYTPTRIPAHLAKRSS